MGRKPLRVLKVVLWLCLKVGLCILLVGLIGPHGRMTREKCACHMPTATLARFRVRDGRAGWPRRARGRRLMRRRQRKNRCLLCEASSQFETLGLRSERWKHFLIVNLVCLGLIGEAYTALELPNPGFMLLITRLLVAAVPQPFTQEFAIPLRACFPVDAGIPGIEIGARELRGRRYLASSFAGDTSPAHSTCPAIFCDVDGSGHLDMGGLFHALPPVHTAVCVRGLFLSLQTETDGRFMVKVKFEEQNPDNISNEHEREDPTQRPAQVYEEYAWVPLHRARTNTLRVVRTAAEIKKRALSWHGREYNFIRRNCQTFVEDIVLFSLGLLN